MIYEHAFQKNNRGLETDRSEIEPKVKGKARKCDRAKFNGGLCSSCENRIPMSEPKLPIGSGEFICQVCSRNKRICVICSAPFYSRVNNKKTCSDACSRAYELKRAIERYQSLSARANASY